MSCGCGSTQNLGVCDRKVVLKPCDETDVTNNNYILSKVKDCLCNLTFQKRLKPIEWQPDVEGDTCINLFPLLPTGFDTSSISCVDIYWNGQRMAQNTTHPDWINFNFNSTTGKITSDPLAVDCIITIDVWYEEKISC